MNNPTATEAPSAEFERMIDEEMHLCCDEREGMRVELDGTFHTAHCATCFPRVTAPAASSTIIIPGNTPSSTATRARRRGRKNK